MCAEAQDMEPKSRFPIRFGPVYHSLSTLLFMRPADSFVEVEGNDVRVQLAWSFRMRFPRSAVVASSEYRRGTISSGVRELAVRWLVSGSGAGIVSITLQPTQRAYVLRYPVRLRNLEVSVENPVGLLDALRG